MDITDLENTEIINKPKTGMKNSLFLKEIKNKLSTQEFTKKLDTLVENKNNGKIRRPIVLMNACCYQPLIEILFELTFGKFGKDGRFVSCFQPLQAKHPSGKTILDKKHIDICGYLDDNFMQIDIKEARKKDGKFFINNASWKSNTAYYAIFPQELWSIKNYNITENSKKGIKLHINIYEKKDLEPLMKHNTVMKYMECDTKHLKDVSSLNIYWSYMGKREFEFPLNQIINEKKEDKSRIYSANECVYVTGYVLDYVESNDIISEYEKLNTVEGYKEYIKICILKMYEASNLYNISEDKINAMVKKIFEILSDSLI